MRELKRLNQLGGNPKEGEMADREEVLLAKLTDKFRNEMLWRLLIMRSQGWTGWNNKRKMGPIHSGLLPRILRNAENGEWVDVANLAMFAWNLENK